MGCDYDGPRDEPEVSPRAYAYVQYRDYQKALARISALEEQLAEVNKEINHMKRSTRYGGGDDYYI